MFLVFRFFLTALFLTTFATSLLTAQVGMAVFTDGPVDRTLLKQQLNYVDHTIDPASAQVHIFITKQQLGPAGRLYKFSFTGKAELAGNQLAFDLTCPATMTAIEIDQAIISRLEIGLAGFLAGTEYAPRLALVVSIDSTSLNEDSATQPANDPGFNWDNWIFEIFSNFSYSKESLRTTSDLRSGIRIDRSTPELRVRINPYYSYWSRTFTTSDDEEIKSFRKRFAVWASAVKSISDHWSVGIFASGQHHSFINVNQGYWLAPAIEYNFFNYDEVPFKEFTAAYRIGYVHNNYLQETIFLKEQETLARHLLDINLRMRQKWGNLFAGISAGAYLNDASMNRFSFDARCDVRILKGLSINVGGNYEIINDQINLPRGDASLEDILLGQTQLATNFGADVRFGLSYTFGSLYNNVVNTRL